jgi:hypothetical protein
MLRKRGIQCNNQHFIQVMPLNNHSIAYKRNDSCTMMIIAKDDGSNRLVGLVVRVSFKVLRVVLIITITSLVLDQCVPRVNGVKGRMQELKDQGR